MCFIEGLNSITLGLQYEAGVIKVEVKPLTFNEFMEQMLGGMWNDIPDVSDEENYEVYVNSLNPIQAITAEDQHEIQLEELDFYSSN